MLSRITSALQTCNLPPDALEIELTETALLTHPEKASELVAQLSEKGVEIAIDDFGTGYGSLSYLVQLPIDTIKIDKSFVDQVDQEASKQSVINGIVAIARGMNLYSVGEGVETEAQYNWLKNAGCQAAQGYLLSRPVSADDVIAGLQQRGGLSRVA